MAFVSLLTLAVPAHGQDDQEDFYAAWKKPNTLAALTPEWLIPWAEQRTRYETFNHPFRANQAGAEQQVALRTRLGFTMKNILDPIRLTFEVADFRAPVSDPDRAVDPAFVDEFDIFQLHGDFFTENLLGTGLTSNLEVGRLVMDFGKGRLVAGYRWGSFTPTFDGIQWTLASPAFWQIRGFLSKPVDRNPFNGNSPPAGSRFWGADVLLHTWPSLKTELYYFGLDEGNRNRKRELSTIGFRLFRDPALGTIDYEIESMYQFGQTGSTNVPLAHRHHGELAYTYDASWRPRVTYLFDYASGDVTPDKNFDFLFAKRRAEYGPTGILGIIFPSNILSPAGFRLAFAPHREVTIMLLNRAFWLADATGPFVGNGLQDPTGQSGSYLGDLLDTAVYWNPSDPLWQHVVLESGYTHFFKGSYYAQVPQSPGTADIDYVYSMVTVRF